MDDRKEAFYKILVSVAFLIAGAVVIWGSIVQANKHYTNKHARDKKESMQQVRDRESFLRVSPQTTE